MQMYLPGFSRGLLFRATNVSNYTRYILFAREKRVCVSVSRR